MINDKTIKSAAKGNIKAFKQIFDYYFPILKAVCRRYCASETILDDVLQETFLKIHQNLNQFQFKGSFEGWIKRIAVYTAISNYKKERAFLFEEHSLEELENIENTEDGSELNEVSSSELMEAINQLPEGYKQVFNLYVLDDYSHKEIGQLLKISEATSRSQLSKAKKMLKKKLRQATNRN